MWEVCRLAPSSWSTFFTGQLLILFQRVEGQGPDVFLMALSNIVCQERHSLMDKASALRSQSPGLDSRCAPPAGFSISQTNAGLVCGFMRLPRALTMSSIPQTSAGLVCGFMRWPRALAVSSIPQTNAGLVCGFMR